MSTTVDRIAASRDIVPATKAKVLGTAGEFQYVTINGAEYVVSPGAADSPADYAAADGQLFISVPRTASDGGRTIQIGNAYRRATPVTPGTYAEMRRKQEQKARVSTKQPPLQLVDALANLRVFSGSAGRSKVTGPHEQAGRLERLGVTVEPGPGGKPLVRARRGALSDHIQAAVTGARLFAGVRAGSLPPCELQHRGKAPQGWTVVYVDVIACEAHVRGEA